MSPSPKASAGSGSVAEPHPPAGAASGGDDGLTPSILHVDMDAFFAAVEVLDDPSLAGKAVIVGGTGNRGVVASCTYEARAFGVRSAMPTVRARQLCPGAVFVDGHFSRYSEMSRQFHAVLHDVTPTVEPIGLDEAFLDVTGARRLLGPPELIAADIRRQVHERLSLACSVGVGRSKMVAKLASRAAKPTANRRGTRPGPGVVVVRAADELAFLHPLAVESLWGVGPATSRRLHELGIRSVGELAAVGEAVMVRHFGRAQGLHLAALARGEDPGVVVPDRPAKSIGHEETFSQDLTEMAELQRHVLRMAESVAAHLRDSELAARTISVKVRYGDFTMITRAYTLPFAMDTGPALGAVAGALLDAVDLGDGVRLLGVSASGLVANGVARQLAFELGDPASSAPAPGPAPGAPDDRPGARPAGRERQAAGLQTSWQEVTAAVDAIRARFGRGSVGTVAMVGDDGIAVPGRREAPWGPSAQDPSV